MDAARFSSPDSTWSVSPEPLVLGGDEVHVWRANLDSAPSQIQEFLRTLAPEERARAERFRFEKDREHFIAGRGVLRAILGGYLKRTPESMTFSYGPHGKPALADTIEASGMRFSVSHSRGVALYAVTRDREVGIDLELVRSDLEFGEIAERFFSPREVATLLSLPAGMQRKAFFDCWTRKEAYIKARGEGLSLPLDRFDVSFAPGEPAAILEVQGDLSEAARWSVQELLPAPDFVAAVAAEGTGWRLCCWQWADSRPQSS
jgi:4'-phosphopantetheinyl transferase